MFEHLVDLVALRTVSAGRSLDVPHGWLLTLGIRIDYFEPVEGPRFLIESVCARNTRAP